MSGSFLTIDFLREKRPLDREQLLSLLKALWTRGIRFSDKSGLLSHSWEETLQHPAWAYAANKRLLTDDETEVTLQEAVQTMAQTGSGSIRLWDHELDMMLLFSPQGEQTRYGLVSLTFDAALINADRVLAPETVPYPSLTVQRPFQMTMTAVIYWTTVLCEQLQPLAATSYHPIEYAPAIEPSVRQTREQFEQSLQNGRVPNPANWRWLTYIAPAFVTSDILLEVFAIPQRWLQRTEQGGLLSVLLPVEFRYEQASILDYRDQATTLFHQDEFLQASACSERARQLSDLIGDQRSVRYHQADHQRALEFEKRYGAEARRRKALQKEQS